MNIKGELRDILPDVITASGINSEQSLNAKIGSRNDRFLDLKNDVIRSHSEFINKWLQGLKNGRTSGGNELIYDNAKDHEVFRKYLLLFLKRSYFNHFDELSKNRPKPEDSEIWIGQTNANYGLLVTPRFNNRKWENDKSEIRAFKQGYWTIGHVMETGFVIPGKDKRFEFSDIDQYLLFFTDTLVRNSGSKYEYELAEYYSNYVISSKDPLSVPLMIPEFRYLGVCRRTSFQGE